MNTTRRWVPKALNLFLVGVLAVAVGGTSLAELVGDRAKLDPLFADLIVPLHKQGIDVVAGDTSEIPLAAKARPRIARLEGMPDVGHARDWKDVIWMKDFVSGAAGFVGAIKPAGAEPTSGAVRTSADEFVRDWSRAPRERRVFLSFTSVDAAHAHAVAKVLAERGYVTFVFLRQGDQAPPFQLDLVGRMFTEAGHRVVLDTESARSRPGVWMEARLARSLIAKPPLPPDPKGGGEPPSSPRPNADGEPGGTTPEDPRPAGPAAPAAESEMERFLHGVGDWVVTRNPSTPGKLFVHRSSSGGMLQDLIYLVKVEKGGAWSVYKPQRSGSGSGFGKRVGGVKAPPSLDIGACSCR